MSNAKRRHRRRYRHKHAGERWVARMEKLGLWGFDRCATWTAENGARVHVLRGGFGYF